MKRTSLMTVLALGLAVAGCDDDDPTGPGDGNGDEGVGAAILLEALEQEQVEIQDYTITFCYDDGCEEITSIMRGVGNQAEMIVETSDPERDVVGASVEFYGGGDGTGIVHIATGTVTEDDPVDDFDQDEVVESSEVFGDGAEIYLEWGDVD